jgi:hypothetical protein
MVVRLHFNKGLAGGPLEVSAEARRCAINPTVADAFCLMIVPREGSRLSWAFQAASQIPPWRSAMR